MKENMMFVSLQVSCALLFCYCKFRLLNQVAQEVVYFVQLWWTANLKIYDILIVAYTFLLSLPQRAFLNTHTYLYTQED